MESSSPTRIVDRGPLGAATATSDLTVIRWCQVGLSVGLMMLATAPLFVADTYSIVENTLSESGGQGVDGAWVFRTGVLMTALSVSVLSTRAEMLWGQRGTFWLRMYALGLVFLAVFPESPWYRGDYDEIVAGLHTVSGVMGAVSFMLGVASVSAQRVRGARIKVFDWSAIVVVGLTPHVMLLVDFSGLLQRSMVLLGYTWLIGQSIRLARSLAQPPPSAEAENSSNLESTPASLTL